MNRTVKDKRGNVISLCGYRYVGPDGKPELCNAPQACPVCGQCSRLDKEHERGHCTGHLGLNEHVPWPGTEAAERLKQQIQKRG